LRRARFAELEWPDYGPVPEAPPRAGAGLYRERIAQFTEAFTGAGFTHAAVYADREHFANLCWLTGFDPRFEEALLVVRPGVKPLLLTGNECMGYLPVSPLDPGEWRVERWQPFSLPDQPRDASRGLAEILADEGIGHGARVAVVGWKWHANELQFDLPSYLGDELRAAAGRENVRDFTGALARLREWASPEDLAWFEWTGMLASESMKRVLLSVREGASDYEMLRAAGYNGVPLSIHMTLKTGGNRISLASARGERARAGDRWSCGIGYWGANCCRCGWVAESGSQAPEGVEEFALGYFEAMAAWFGALRIGATGDELHRAIHDRLPAEVYRVFLNAGHLIHLEEWLSAPVYEGSEWRLHSGVVMQSDVIPSNPVLYSARMEDGYALADGALRTKLPQGLLERAERRREFMGSLGVEVAEDVLPLSNLAGVMPLWMLRPKVAARLGGR
jgi:Xaa-Pro aminopeptidase